MHSMALTHAELTAFDGHPTRVRRLGVVQAYDDEDPLRELLELLRDQRSTFAWALRHAGQGDPLPQAWLRCVDARVMFFYAAILDRAQTSVILQEVAISADSYPHARECLLSADRELRLHRRASAESLLDSALIHFPGRGTAMPRPHFADRLNACLCEAFRRRIVVNLEGIQAISL